MAGAMGVSALTGSPTAKEQPPPKTAADNPAPKMATEAVKGIKTGQAQKPDKKHMMEAVSFLESSNGKLMDHPWIDKGPHAGTRAIGRYALMPNTVHELVSKSPKLKAKYGEVLNRDSQGGVEDYFTENPQFEHDLASHYIDQIHQQTGSNDPGVVGTAWLHGITGAKKMMDDGTIKNNERYQKTLQAYENAKKLHDNRVNLHLAKK